MIWSILNSILCNYSDACIFVKGTVTFIGQAANTATIQADRDGKKECLKILHHLTTLLLAEINNTEIDDASCNGDV